MIKANDDGRVSLEAGDSVTIDVFANDALHPIFLPGLRVLNPGGNPPFTDVIFATQPNQTITLASGTIVKMNADHHTCKRRES
ncbi:hypothetical protein [Halocynthiibacter sp.]|uniref:hypothetical protein n=1 Tax=Halocynthiibacter sp. TaxID=1979210 RepID=UPI003C56F301